MLKKNKKGQIISGLVGGIAGLIILVIVSLLIVDTLASAGLLTTDSAADNATDDMIANYTAGIDNISEKLPTVLLIAAVVLLFGAIVFLVQRSRSITATQGGSI